MTEQQNQKHPVPSQSAPEHEDLNVLMVRRREELENLKNAGINPYAYEYDRSDFSSDIVSSFKDDEPQRTVRVSGRITSIRRMGKA